MAIWAFVADIIVTQINFRDLAALLKHLHDCRHTYVIKNHRQTSKCPVSRLTMTMNRKLCAGSPACWQRRGSNDFQLGNALRANEETEKLLRLRVAGKWGTCVPNAVRAQIDSGCVGMESQDLGPSYSSPSPTPPRSTNKTP